MCVANTAMHIYTYSVQLRVGVILAFCISLSYLILFSPYIIVSYTFRFLYILCYMLSYIISGFSYISYLILSCRIVLRVAFGAIERLPSQHQHSVLNDAIGRSDQNLPAQAWRLLGMHFILRVNVLIWTPQGCPTGPPTRISKYNR